MGLPAMTTLTHTFRFRTAPQCAPFAAFTPVQEQRLLLGVSLAFLAGGAAVVLHALSAVTAFY
jgi:hypothetical protein